VPEFPRYAGSEREINVLAVAGDLVMARSVREHYRTAELSQTKVMASTEFGPVPLLARNHTRLSGNTQSSRLSGRTH
jgi:hypothetical protein